MLPCVMNIEKKKRKGVVEDGENESPIYSELK
jgi:hypothetical protein